MPPPLSGVATSTTPSLCAHRPPAPPGSPLSAPGEGNVRAQEAGEHDAALANQLLLLERGLTQNKKKHNRWGQCFGNNVGQYFPQISDVLPDKWCVGDYDAGSTNSWKGDYQDLRMQLMNSYGGRFGVAGQQGAFYGFNLNDGEQNVCYVTNSLFYTASGTALPFP
jgi:hypothetical protein